MLAGKATPGDGPTQQVHISGASAYWSEKQVRLPNVLDEGDARCNNRPTCGDPTRYDSRMAPTVRLGSNLALIA
jgi:hypothetical protein